MNVFGKEQSLSKGFHHGTHRTRPPAETVREYWPLHERLGVTRLANVTGLDYVGIPVYTAIRPNARSLSVSQGKGLDEDAARASALMESIELWHAERIAAPLRYESYAELSQSACVVDIHRLQRLPGALVHEGAPILWIEGFDLMQERPTWVPFETVNLNNVGSPSATPMFGSGSNGLASGNHVLEAITHGLCELIERDTTTLFYQLKPEDQRRRRVRRETVPSPACQHLLQCFERADIDVGVLDLTLDLGVPTYMCVIAERPGRPHWRRLGAFLGYGTNPSAEVAFIRAVTEAAQSRLTIIAGNRDDNPQHRLNYGFDERVEALLRAKYLDIPEVLDISERPSLSTPTFEGDVGVLLSALRGIGIESAIAVDLTRPDIGIPVVKMVVPGLEGMLQHGSYEPGERALAFARKQWS
jgi:ribosomal protein S12 methylthiotransferase accessory factor